MPVSQLKAGIELSNRLPPYRTPMVALDWRQCGGNVAAISTSAAPAADRLESWVIQDFSRGHCDGDPPGNLTRCVGALRLDLAVIPTIAPIHSSGRFPGHFVDWFCTFRRIASIAQPLARRWDCSEGASWRIFAAVALLSRSRHHTKPSIGPAVTQPRRVGGISACTAARRATESRVSSLRRKRVGDCWDACSSVTG